LKRRVKRDLPKKDPDESRDIPGGLPERRISISRANRGRIIAVALLVFIAAFMAYANTLMSDFIWDDEYLILNNSQIKSFSHLGNVFKTYVGYGSENINNFYRPLQEISNMVDYFLWGDYPIGFHLTNVVLHALVAVMVFVFLFYLTGNIPAAGIAALFYAVHPVHSEAVAYIAGRADSLYSVFMLLSFVFFIRFVNQARSGKTVPLKYFLSIIFFVLSLISKEIVISMPLLVLLYLLYFVKDTRDNDLYVRLRWSWTPYAVISGIYVWLRLTVLDFSNLLPPSAFGKISLVYRILTFFRAIGVYFRLMVFPVGLHMERSISISKSLIAPSSIMAFAMIVVIGWVAYKTYRRNRFVSFAIVWFFVNLLPVSNIVPINNFLAEHWIYMASIGPFLLFGMGVAWSYKNVLPDKRYYKVIGILALAVLLGMYARATVIRNMDWKNEIAFFNSTLKYHPRNARLYLNLGNTYYEKGDTQKAIEQYRKAIDINKKYAVAYGNIGSACLHEGKTDEAEEYLVQAIAIKHNYPIAHYNLGIIYFQKKRYTAAEKELTTAVEQLPQLYQAWNMLGRLYLKKGKFSEAKNSFQRSLAIMPEQPPIQRILQKLQ